LWLILIRRTQTIVKLATLQPQLDITNLKTEKLGNGLVVYIDAMNKGLLPPIQNWVKGLTGLKG
jgi:hypothetical protein